MIKQRIIIFFLFALPIGLCGQEKESPDPKPKKTYIGLAFGTTSTKVMEQTVTSQKYTGNNFFLELNRHRIKAASEQEIYWKAIIGAVQTEGYDPDIFNARFRQPRAQFYWTEIGYNYWHQLQAFPAAGQLWVGGNFYGLISARFSERWDNSAINFDGAILLAAQARFSRPIAIRKRKMDLHFSVNLPVTGIVLRPNYTGVNNFLDHETDFFEETFQNKTWVWAGQFPRVKTAVLVDYPLKTDSKLQFAYEWDYYSFQNPWQVQAANHIFFVNFLMRLK